MARVIDELLPEVLLHAPNTADMVAFRFLREAARKLCHEAKTWREWCEFNVTAPQSQGIITIPDAEIVEIETAQLNDRNLTPVTIAWLDAHHPRWDIELEESTASYVTQISPNTISVWPRETGNCTLRLLLQPSRDAVTFPDVLVEKFNSVIGREAAAQILMLPGGEAANPQLGLALHTEFLAMVASLKVQHTKGQQGARLRTRGDWF